MTSPASIPFGLRLTLGVMAVVALGSASAGLEEALLVLDRQVVTPQALGPGLTLARARAEGDTWFQAVNAEREFAPPEEPEFRAMLRARCTDPVLGRIVAKGGTVQEARTWGPNQIHVFTLRMTPDICGQVGLD